MKNLKNSAFILFLLSIFSLCLYAADDSTEEMDFSEPYLGNIDAGAWSQVGTRHMESEDTYLCEPIGQYFNISRHTDYIFGVFDGHGGKKVSEYLMATLKLLIVAGIGPEKDHNKIESALLNAFNIADNSVRSIKKQGSTALVVLLIDDVLYIANAGDSRAVLCREQDGQINITTTNDHKPTYESEKIRIEKAGGQVIFFQGAYRVGGNLSCSRSIGDHPKQLGLSAVPEIFIIKLNPSHKLLALGSDGVFDVLSNQKVVELAKRSISLRNVEKAAKVIVNSAKNAGSPDDLTAIVVSFKWL